MTYAGRQKYDEPGRAGRYAARSARRDEEEWRLLARLLDALPEAPRSALDVPCGTGRVAARLLERGIPTACADLSPAMREETRARLRTQPGFRGVAALDLEVDPGRDPALRADLVVCFRLLHHLPDAETRGRVLRSLRRLAGRDLLLSFHHPVSAHNLERAARRVLTGRRGDRYTITRRRLAREARAAGLELKGTAALGRWRRELWVAWLVPVPRTA